MKKLMTATTMIMTATSAMMVLLNCCAASNVNATSSADKIRMELLLKSDDSTYEVVDLVRAYKSEVLASSENSAVSFVKSQFVTITNSEPVSIGEPPLEDDNGEYLIPALRELLITEESGDADFEELFSAIKKGGSDSITPRGLNDGLWTVDVTVLDGDLESVYRVESNSSKFHFVVPAERVSATIDMEKGVLSALGSACCAYVFDLDDISEDDESKLFELLEDNTTDIVSVTASEDGLAIHKQEVPGSRGFVDMYITLKSKNSLVKVGDYTFDFEKGDLKKHESV
jgi:hypothetical protein